MGLTIRTYLRGGLRRWWFVQRRYIASWPAINPASQMLLNAPELLAGGEWLGPVHVTDKQQGFTETLERTKAGHVWKQKISGFIPGIGSQNHLNLENLAHEQFAVIAQPRNTNIYFVIGGPNSWLRLNPDFTTGEGRSTPPGTNIEMMVTTAQRSLLLAGFTGGNEYGTDPLPPFAGLRTWWMQVPADGLSVTIPELVGKSLQAAERSGMNNLNIILTGTPTTQYDAVWISTTATLTVATDWPFSAGETLALLYQ